MGNGTSPEEKLLKLIKGQKHKDTPQAPSVPAVPAATRTVPRASFPARFRRLAAFFTAGRVITICFILAGIYFAASLGALFSGYKKVEPLQGGVGLQGSAMTDSALEAQQDGGKRPFDFYAQSIGGRNIFVSEGEPQENSHKTESAINNEALKDLNVVGIIADSNPQVIIEDKKNQKTHYVRVGQYIGDFMIEEIQSSKIILSNKGQRFELNM